MHRMNGLIPQPTTIAIDSELLACAYRKGNKMMQEKNSAEFNLKTRYLYIMEVYFLWTFTNTMYCGAKVLTLISFVLGAISIGTLSLSVATDSWLFTEEEMECEVDNITVMVPVQVRSGLFRFCTIYSEMNSGKGIVLL